MVNLGKKMGSQEKSPLPLIPKLFINPNSQSRNSVFYFLLLLIGICMGVVSTMCFRSFSLLSLPPAVFTFSSQTSPPPRRPPPPPARVRLQPRPKSTRPVVSAHNLTSNNRSTHDHDHDHFKNDNITSSIVSLKDVTSNTSKYSKNNNTSRSSISFKDLQAISLMHDMGDKELLEMASNITMVLNSREPPFSYKFVPKVAFMFLTPGPLPLSPLWEMFFRGHDQALYSIYVHPHPSYKDSWPENSVFYRRRISSKPVSWGSITMLDAERRLLANALLDISNQRFLLLSDSCIPVFNFTTVYHYLVNSDLSYLNIYDDPRKPGRGRYNPQMRPTITIEQWRKGSQWFEVRRDLAVLIISDKNYYEIFRQYCHLPCVHDEHYLPTMVHILYPEMSTRRSVTWVDWSKGGPHPKKYGRTDVTEEVLYGIRRRSYCNYNGENNAICFLFARKFLPDTIKPLLRVAPNVLGLVSE